MMTEITLDSKSIKVTMFSAFISLIRRLCTHIEAIIKFCFLESENNFREAENYSF